MSLAPELHVEKQYLDGYVPSSFDAPHSSLQRSITWVGMGAILASLAGFGLMVFGLATWQSGVQELGPEYALAGAILGFGLLFGGMFMIHLGRKNYREYKARTGRIH
ncbi:hypothetical protein F7230_05175 [Corynebacterium sp. 320]|uniref:hypothetical protein n=1 Tax=Corynebacterium TaxID=1716 RepID=UPI00125CC340|nr:MULTISPECIES: hypothetical protein [Corynebacterium]KAB1504456.1 hypothetical protein F7230_05175 [Corynebacterium sp. 320]KAB1552445.1 hypothetical protein F7233_01425 [Corynebacterium sp. 321]KAB1554340.1 hypothetical protein F7232_05175 [Corynebacterium sp. 319]KAB3528592.1 hypothetical protein F8354_05175 [Corynebacterium sp. 250]KAB3539916.1 hypothetical protein F8390_01155 [Corynebacterium sp. 366]